MVICLSLCTVFLNYCCFSRRKKKEKIFLNAEIIVDEIMENEDNEENEESKLPSYCEIFNI